MLENIRIVLINTSHPGNIGAAARAMKTMGLGRLYLVQPEQYPNAEATSRASGADDLLARAQVCATLEEALAGCRWVVGLSARERRLAVPPMHPRACAEQLRAEAAEGEVALLFGRERSGLSNEELDRCHALVHIPANPDYSSLNLAAAVQVMAYELRVAALGEAPAGAAEPAAAAEALELLYEHFERAMVGTGFLDPENPRLLLRRLRRLFNRARLEPEEVAILRGFLTSVERPHPPSGGNGK